jgi:hypothetical protein
VKFGKIDANPQAGVPEKRTRTCEDTDDDCGELQKRVAVGDYRVCGCRLFRLVKDDPTDDTDANKKQKAKWELVEDNEIHKDKELDTPKPGEDKEYYYACFCVTEVS